MAARFKRKPPGSYNKLLKLDKLTLLDFMCTICQSIYIEPVTLPCYHDFCFACFNGTIENNALSCPLCRTRIGSWLRKASKQNNLINSKLWEFIKDKYPEEVKIKLNGEDIAISEEEDIRIISAPGEIRLEYESEILKIRREQQLLEEKHSKETEKLIRELQEQEQREKEESKAKLRQDELLARQLAETTRLRGGHRRPIHQFNNPPPHPPTTISSANNPSRNTARSHTLNSALNASINSSLNSTPNSSSKNFYKHLSSANKAGTLDNYLVKGGSNGYLKTGSGGTPPSPELMSTTGRCGRFLKNFLNVKLWGQAGQHPSTSKAEPKVWEPQQACAGHSRELSVRSGVVLHHDSIGGVPGPPRLHPPPRQQGAPRGPSEAAQDPDTSSEDSLAQELCYFKPLHPAPINRFSGRTMRCIPVKPRARRTSPELTLSRAPDISQLMNGLEKLRNSDAWPHRPQSSFVCLLSVPASYVKEREEAVKLGKIPSPPKSNHKSNRRKLASVKHHTPAKVTPTKPKNVVKKSGSGNESADGSRNKYLRSNTKKEVVLVHNEVTPKKTSPRKSSRSSVKLVSNGTFPADQVLTRSKRSISFGDLTSASDSSTSNNKQPDNHVDSNKLKDKSKVSNGKMHNGDAMSGSDDFKISIPNTRVLRRNGQLPKCKDNLASDKINQAVTRRMSNQLAEEERNGDEIKHNNNHSDYVINGVKDTSPKSSDGKPNRRNGLKVNESNSEVNGNLNEFEDINPSLLEEQRRIEELIAQEKRDFALAKKLQKQLCRSDYISTGYTIRTATKRQATLNEMLPTPKKMKV